MGQLGLGRYEAYRLVNGQVVATGASVTTRPIGVRGAACVLFVVRARAITLTPTFAYEYGVYATRDAPRTVGVQTYQGVVEQNVLSAVLANVQNGVVGLVVPTQGAPFMRSALGVHSMDLKITIGGAGADATLDVDVVAIYS